MASLPVWVVAARRSVWALLNLGCLAAVAVFWTWFPDYFLTAGQPPSLGAEKNPAAGVFNLLVARDIYLAGVGGLLAAVAAIDLVILFDHRHVLLRGSLQVAYHLLILVAAIATLSVLGYIGYRFHYT